MTNVRETFLSDESSDEDDSEPFQTDFDRNRASFSDYETNRASLSLSDFEANRLSFTSEPDNPLSDPESTKDYNTNHHYESNSEEETKPYFPPSTTRTEKVTFYKFGQPTKVIHKPSATHNNMPTTINRNPSTDSEDPEEYFSSQKVDQQPSTVIHQTHTTPYYNMPSMTADNDTYTDTFKRERLSCSDSEGLEEVPAKRTKYDDLARPSQGDVKSLDKAKAMMEKMGYKEGRGLGKHAQGRVAPVEMSKQRGRRGLGLTLPGLEPANLQWDSSMEVVKVEEQPKWLDGSHLPPLDIHTLQSWKQRGPRNLKIEEYNEFCDPSVLTNILNKKSMFDSLDDHEMRKARARSNPFETIGKGMFLNRAAMKMANMDRVFDFMFTSPQTQDDKPMISKGELLYFADVCAGPGGFSEYVLWRKKWRAKGFGFTLKGENDFKLSDFFSGPCESFEPYYGVKDDGNVFDPDNINSLMHFVMDNTQQIGVHFMMADGGFSVEGQENIQELLSKQLYLCQFLVALCIVRKGGHFVCKLFDIFSPFSVGLVYLMYRAFERVSIHKPNTSRPANSERYIICKWKRDDCEPTREYLFNLNEELCRLGSDSTEDINYCVSMEQLTQDQAFFDYIVESNNVIGENQIVNLVKIQAFCRDVNLLEMKQNEIKLACLAYWKVPDLARRVDKTSPEEWISRRLSKPPNFLEFNDTHLEEKKESRFLKSINDLKSTFKSVYDWHCVPVASHNEQYFFLGLGRNKVHRLSQGGKFWTKVETSSLELSPGTLVYGELVTEVQGACKSQLKKTFFHIIDVITLGEEDIRHLHYTERLKMCQLYAESLRKSTRRDLIQIRVKEIYNLDDVNRLFRGLTVYVMKNGTQELLLGTDDKFAFQPKGVIFIKATKEPWARTISRSTGHCYYHQQGRDPLYDKDRPPDACASTEYCLKHRKVWIWDYGVGIHKEPPQDNKLHKDHLLHFINAINASVLNRR